MKVFTVTLLSVILATCYGYSYIIPASMKHPGICYYNGHVLSKGDNQMPTTCQNMKCNEDGSILIQGCGRLDVKNCIMMGPANLDKPYPDCCQMSYRCKDEDGNMYTKQWNQLKQEEGSDSNERSQDDDQRKQAEQDQKFDMQAKADREDEENQEDEDDMNMQNAKMP